MASTSFNIEQFKSALTNGGARPNQFLVFLSFPEWVNIAPTAVAKAPFLVSVSELPGSVVPPATVLYRGRAVNFAGDRTFAPWTITVLNDSDFSIRTGLEQWMNGMDNLSEKYGYLRPSSYQKDASISQLDRNGSILKTYELKNIMPVDVSPVGMDFGANDVISTFTATFVYQYYLTNGVSAGPTNVQQNDFRNFSPLIRA
jgi:hypothetical protein